jgi:hypothetical protein
MWQLQEALAAQASLLLLTAAEEANLATSS